MTTKVIYYVGRVWTCDKHNSEISEALLNGEKREAVAILHSIDPTKGKSCTECARLYEETPPCNRR